MKVANPKIDVISRICEVLCRNCDYCTDLYDICPLSRYYVDVYVLTVPTKQTRPHSNFCATMWTAVVGS